MNSKGLRYAVVAAAALAIAPLQVFGQSSADRAGTAGATYLLVPTSARTVSMGGAITSGLSDLMPLEALEANPAGIALNTGTSVMFSRVEYVADIGINTFGIAQKIGNNHIGLVVSAWDFGEIPLTTETDPEVTNLTYEAGNSSVGLTFGRVLTDRISAGFTLKMLNEKIADVNSSGFAIDAGMQYAVGESGLRFGVALKNFGPGMKYGGEGLQRDIQLPGQEPGATSNAVAIDVQKYELPSLLNFGISYTRELASSASVTALAHFRSNAYDQDQYTGGLELALLDILFVRGSYQWQEDIDQTMYSGVNFGAGLNYQFNSGQRISVDYAYVGTDYFSEVQVITASITL